MSIGGRAAVKTWRLQDVFRYTSSASESEPGKAIASIFKLEHPHRKQQLTLITTPRFASETYYKDWVYQPYAKENRLFISSDLYVPTAVFLPRLLLNRKQFPGYQYFTPMNLPDSIDLNLSRRQHFQKEKPIKCGVIQTTMFLNIMRDKRHGWLPRRVKSIVGERYVNHPREEDQSLVLMMPPAYVATALNTLQDLGFTVKDRVDAECGDVEPIKKLHSYSDIGQFAALSYVWMLLFVFLASEFKRFLNSFEDYKREMIVKAGKDPKDFGFE